jgi:hypothetical protein
MRQRLAGDGGFVKAGGGAAIDCNDHAKAIVIECVDLIALKLWVSIARKSRLSPRRSDRRNRSLTPISAGWRRGKKRALNMAGRWQAESYYSSGFDRHYPP